MKPKLLITRKLPEEIIDKAEKNFEVIIWDNELTPIPDEVLSEKIEQVDGLLCLLTDNINKEVLNRAKNLKVIANLAVGFDNIDVNSAKRKGIIVTNTPGVLTDTTADLTFGLMLATARRMVEANNFIKKGEWGSWSPFQLTGNDVHNAKLGVIGMGRIAQAFIKRAKGFDMDICYFNRSRKIRLEEKFGIYFKPLEDLLITSDFICLFIPYTKDSHHMISMAELQKMKKNAILINTARGGLVDEKALYKALIDKVISGAGLDVFENEPINSDNSLLNLSNVVSLPHIGSASEKTRLKMAHISVDNIYSVLYEKKPVNEV